MSALRACARRASLKPRIASSSGRLLSTTSTLSTTKDDPWAHIFEAMDEVDAKIAVRESNGPRRHRRQSMTAGEINAFDGMFSLIFDSLKQQQLESAEPVGGVPFDGAAIGRTTGLADVVGKLRGKARRARWTTAEDEALDRMKEEMELCDTDAALLAWARRTVFADPLAPGPIYPALLALLMRAFRDRFGDPHLALSVFNHARHVSVPSFVFGCTTPAYNELLQTRWDAFRDLRGVRDTLDEMRVNGVATNGRTRTLVEAIRREVGERNAWIEDSMSGGEVWTMVQDIETLSAPPVPIERRTDSRPRRWRSAEEWKYRMRDMDSGLKADALDAAWQDDPDLLGDEPRV